MAKEILYQINPDRGRPWNELPALPIAEQLFRTIDIYEQLAKAKEALGRLHGRSIAIPNQGLLINSICLQEAKASNAIENIFTTDDELYRAYSESIADQIDGPAKEVLRYRESLWSGYTYLKNQSGFDREYFIRVYREIKQTTDGIRPYFAPIIIRQGGSGPNAGQIIYTPPRGEGLVEAKLDNLIDFLNNDEQYCIDPLLKMAISHFQFEAIHPFRDGNGRAGRVFNIHYLTKKGLLDYPILYLSRYINEHKDEYYSGLSGISQRGDWHTWFMFMLRAVEVTAFITFQKINDIISAKDAIQKAVEKDTNIRRLDQFIQMIFTQPFIKVKHLTDAGLYAENTARNYLNKLADMQVLEKKTMQGHHYYLNLELYRILSD